MPQGRFSIADLDPQPAPPPRMGRFRLEDLDPAPTPAYEDTREPDFRVDVVGEMPRETGLFDRARDVGLSALKGTIAVPEAAVGLADIATGGRVGRFLEDTVGFQPQVARDILSRFYSRRQQEAFGAVEQADGFVAKAIAALSHPSVVAHSVIESAPSMLAGGGVSRALPIARIAAAGIGEGVVAAGAAAEQTRQQADDRLLTPGQSALAATSGAVTGALGAFSGRLAQQLGIADIDTMLAGAAVNATARKGLTRQVIEGALKGGFTEGVLEELPQSVQEQVLANVAQGRDVLDGVDEAAVMGALAGATMGGGVNVVSGLRRQRAALPVVEPPSTVAEPAPAPAVDLPLTPPTPAATVPPPTVVAAPPELSPVDVPPVGPPSAAAAGVAEPPMGMFRSEEIETPAVTPAETGTFTAAEIEGAPEEQYSYGSTQVNLPEAIASQITALSAAIPDEDLAEDGREAQPHVTVQYGLEEDNVDAIRAALEGEPPITVTFGKTSLFENDDADVVKVDVESDDLRRLRTKIAAAVPAGGDTHPSYAPHATLAYVKPGRGKAYTDNAALEGQTAVIDRLVVSGKDGGQVEVALTGTRASGDKLAPADMSDADLQAESAEFDAREQRAFAEMEAKEPYRAAQIRAEGGYLEAADVERRSLVNSELGRRVNRGAATRVAAKRAARLAASQVEPPFNRARDDTRSRSIDASPAVRQQGLNRDHAFLMRWLADDLNEIGFQESSRMRGIAAIDEATAARSQEEARARVYSPRVAGTPTLEMFQALGVKGSRAEIAMQIDRFLVGDAKKPTKAAAAAQRLAPVLDAAWDGQRFDFARVSDEQLSAAGISREALRAPITLPSEEQPADLVERFLAKSDERRAGEFQAADIERVESDEAARTAIAAEQDAALEAAPETDDLSFDVAAIEQDESDDVVRARTIAEFEADPDGLIDRYVREYRSVLNADNASELFRDYNRSPEARAKRFLAVRPAAARVVERAFERLLREPVPPGKRKLVVFTSGGNASGKSTDTNPDSGAAITFDSTLSRLDPSLEKIEQALTAGFDVQIRHVSRDPVEAWRSVLDRAMGHGEGRSVTIAGHMATHKGARDTLLALEERFRSVPNVDIKVYESGATGITPRSLDWLRQQAYPEGDGLRSTLHTVLEDAHEAGGVSEAVYRAARGQSGGARPDRARGPRAGEQADSGRREEAPVDARQRLINRYKPDNPFAERAARARIEADRLNKPTARDAAMAEAFPLGAGFGRKGDAKRSDRSIDRAVAAVKAAKDASYLEAQAEAFDRGVINAQGRRTSAASRARSEKRETSAQSRDARMAAAKATRGDKPAWQVPPAVWADSTGNFGGGARRLILSEHREAVEQALADGRSVPSDVLAEYPDLRPSKADGPPGAEARSATGQFQPTDIDTLDTGEQQPRLPGETGRVREQEQKTPEFEAPFSLTSELSQVPTAAQRDLLTEMHGPARTDEEMAPFRAAARIFQQAKEDYQARRIGDAEYLAARRTFEQAQAEDEARISKPQRGGSSGGTEASIGDFANLPAKPGTLVTRPATLLAPAEAAPLVKETRAVELPEIVAFARRLGGIPQVVKSFRGDGVRGTFREGSVRIRADLFKPENLQQLAATLAHEIGHWIDWLPDFTLKRGNLLGHLRSMRTFLKHTFTSASGDIVANKDVRRELQALSDAWRPWDPAKASASFAAYRRSAKELYADAVSVLFNNPGMLEAEAPTFYRIFFEEINRKPEVQRAYFDLQALLSGTREELIANREASVNRMFKIGNAKAIEIERLRQAEKTASLRHVWTMFRIQFIDKNAPLIDRVKALQKRGIYVPEDEDPRYFLEERSYLGGRIKAFTETYFQPVYAALLDADITWDDFGKVLFYERVIAGDRSEMANPLGLSAADTQELLDKLHTGLSAEQRKVLAQAVARFRDGVRTMAEQAFKAGLYKPELYQEMKKNPAYATYRVIEHMERDLTSKVHHQIGTLKDIDNPANSTMLKTLVTLRAIEYQRMKVATIKFLETHFPEDIEQARYAFTGKGMSPIPPPDPKKQALITYMEQGKQRGVYVDLYIADSINNGSIGHNVAPIVALRWVNNYLRPIFTGMNPGFQTVNFPRDFGRFWKNTPTMTVVRALRRYLQAVPLARVRAYGLPKSPSATLKQAREDLREAEAQRIFSVTYNDLQSGRQVEDTQVEDILARVGVGAYASAPPRTGAARALYRFLDWIKNTGDFIETLPKAAAIYEFKGAGSISDLTPAQRSFIRRKVGSPDYLAGGTLKPISNELLLFSNAITQAWRADLEVARDPQTRSGFWFKTAAVSIAPKLALFAALYLVPDDDDDESWWGTIRRALEGVTEYDLTNYIPIPVGIDEAGNTIYARLPQDDGGRLIGGLTWKILQALRGDREAMKAAMQVLDYTAGQVPSVSPVVQTGADIIAFASGKNVYDPFRSRFLFTDDELKAQDWHTIKKFLGYEFQQLGGGIVWKFYPGEARPREMTTGQTILDLPIVSNIAARWIRITNYGKTERMRETQAAVQRDEARVRLTERDAVSEALQQYRRLAPPDQTKQQQTRLAREVVQQLYADAPPKERERQLKDVLKKIRMGAVRGKADPVVDAVMSATSTAQRVAILRDAADDMTPEAFAAWMKRAQQEEVISAQLADAVRRDQRGAP